MLAFTSTFTGTEPGKSAFR